MRGCSPLDTGKHALEECSGFTFGYASGELARGSVLPSVVSSPRQAGARFRKVITAFFNIGYELVDLSDQVIIPGEIFAKFGYFRI
ncbi:MAG: hypothetical protein RBS37_06455 [Bacteroidales bacterium]|nr:hypothetical protein [Bacteroidales bacterium]